MSDVDRKPRRTVSQDLRSMSTDALFDALGDPTRRAILQRLREGPKPVVEIWKGLPVSRPAVSQHLKVLKDARLVIDQAQGTRHLYAVDPNGLLALRRFLETFWAQALVSFSAAAERSTPRRTSAGRRDG